MRPASTLLACLILGLPLCGQELDTKSDTKADTKAFHVQGRVVDEGHQPLPGVRLSVGHGGVGKAIGTTGADGSFLIRLPAQDEDSILSRVSEFLDLESGGRLLARVMVGRRSVYGFQRRTHGTQDLGTMVLPKGKPIQVRVRKGRGRPLPGALVVADSPVPASPFPFAFSFGLGSGSGDVTPTYFSRAMTDEKGAAVLYGHGDEGVRVGIAADGYYRKQLPFHGPGMPLVVVMEESGFISGKVVDHEGKPVRALLSVLAEVKPVLFAYMAGIDAGGNKNYSAEDGSFRLNLDYRHRYRVSANLIRGASFYHHPPKTSSILNGPQQDVVIKLDKPKGVEGGVAVHVVDAESREPIAGFRAAAIWQNLKHVNDTYLEAQFENTALRAKEKGKLILPPPTHVSQRSGGVMVKAGGYATMFVKDVEWDDDKPVRVNASLSKELPVHGVVVDDKTGKPVVGARVWAVRKRKQNTNVSFSYYGIQQNPTAVRTDAKGRFRLHGLGKGKHKVHVQHVDHPDLKSKTINLKPETPLDALTLKMPHGFRYAGKIKGGQQRPGWKLKLVAKRGGGRGAIFLGAQSVASGQTRKIGADGSFEFLGLKEGDYTPYLVVPRLGGPAMDIKLPSEIEVDAGEENVELDITKGLPGRIQGKVAVNGIPAPTGRLVLVAAAGSSSNDIFTAFMSDGSGAMTGPKATIRRDGTFDLALAPGKYQLKVVDAGTGVVVWQGEDRVKVEAGKPSHQELTVELVLVRVRLMPKTEGGKIVATRLGVMVDWPKPDQGRFARIGGMVVEGPSGVGLTGAGVPLTDGQREIDLYLPPRETKLVVVSNARILKLGQQQGTVPPLAKHEFTPEAGRTNRIEIEVPPPPEIEDSADEKGEKDEKAAPAEQVRRSVRIKRR